MAQVSDKIEEIEKAIELNLGRGDLAERTRQVLEENIAIIRKALEEIVAVEQYVPLPIALDKPKQYDFRYHGLAGVLNFDDIMNVSILLKELHSAGIQIKNLQWFSDEEMMLSQQVAANYREISGNLKSFRKSKKRNDEYSFISRDNAHLKIILRILEDNADAKITSVLVKTDGDKKFKPFKWKEWSFVEGHTYMVIYVPNDAKLRHLLLGDWMTAFIASVIEDHLTRNNVHHEVFTKLSYSAPVDIIRSQSDFDVISMFEGKTFCFECKSGVIGRELAGEVFQKAQEIALVLERFAPSVDEFRYFVVYDDQVNEDEFVLSLFEGSRVEPRRIDQIRELISGALE